MAFKNIFIFIWFTLLWTLLRDIQDNLVIVENLELMAVMEHVEILEYQDFQEWMANLDFK